MDEKKFLTYAQALDRSLFVGERHRDAATLDRPLPIGHGQTISQPSLVWMMTRLLAPDTSAAVLEIGTGSGYQTALLAAFSKHVYTVERLEPLSLLAKQRLDTLGHRNISYHVGDGSDGWPAHAPYPRIIVTAAAKTLPVPLVDQLAANGTLVIPLGPPGFQELMVLRKDAAGKLRRHSHGHVAFVEMKGRFGWSDDS